MQDHLSQVAENSRQVVQDKNLNFSLFSKNEIDDLSYLIGIAHDFGKSTTYFQGLLPPHSVDGNHTHHAPISSLFAYVLVQERFPEKSIAPLLAYLTVRYHHGNLQSPQNPFTLNASVQKQLKNIQDKQFSAVAEMYSTLLQEYDLEFLEVFDVLSSLVEEEIIERDFSRKVSRDLHYGLNDFEEEQQIEVFLLSNFLFSVLIDSDKKAAGKLDVDYFENACELVVEVDKYLEHLREGYPGKFNPEKPLNAQRNAFFREVTANQQLNPDNHIYTITAPTGIGKTYAAFGAANNLKRQLEPSRRIIYALPFTSIIDQNYEEFEQLLAWSLEDAFTETPTKYLLKHHYLSPMEIIRSEKRDSEISQDYANYYDDRMLNELWDAGNIVTTFVQLFQSIIGYQNRWLKKFHNIVNSIIILDEVQNIPADYHTLVGKVFEIFARKFDTYIFLMTATQPHIFSPEQSVALVESDKYFEHPLFNRVIVEKINGLSGITIDKFIQKFNDGFSGDSGLIVCNTKKSALEIYNRISENPQHSAQYKIKCLTTLQTPADRKSIIHEIGDLLSRKEKVICVSTQLIEAGIDLSFQTVYRDMGPFDSIVQVAGRCNRHGELDEPGKMYIMRLQRENGRDYSGIYDPKLMQMAGETVDAPHFESRDFLRMSHDYFSGFDFVGESNRLLQGLQRLNYSEEMANETAVKDFQLIEQRAEQQDVIICTDTKSEQHLQRFLELHKSLSDTERRSAERKNIMGEIRYLRQKLADYTISVFANQLIPYHKSADIKSEINDNLLYVPLEIAKQENIYTKETGFNLEPDSVTTTSMI
ncbi:MAG: CRISPR-associated helicase Cas3' [Candidatus Marinimicrobia bacterium]|nr:CRISPR-associated helicase Cas3' [Candidatus Neomarinimicrobiota bacterium]MCF7828061.1 CRISPR-associated helicase Cas3' [Candidatus Neomarinimicrobiota bacterium]MCF7879184.1 CRISPR-associated helicase Cas3' [Candidatus Neomarinimicrobiota bacterium]